MLLSGGAQKYGRVLRVHAWISRCLEWCLVVLYFHTVGLLQGLTDDDVIQSCGVRYEFYIIKVTFHNLHIRERLSEGRRHFSKKHCDVVFWMLLDKRSKDRATDVTSPSRSNCLLEIKK